MIIFKLKHFLFLFYFMERGMVLLERIPLKNLKNRLVGYHIDK